MSVAYRLILFFPTLLCISVLCFVLTDIQPGDFLGTMSDSVSSAGQMKNLRTLQGQEGSLGQRYFFWLGNALRGDWGMSLAYGQPVNILLKERLMPTLTLSVVIALLKWLTAVPAALYVSHKDKTLASKLITFLGRISLAMPDFFLAALILWLSVYIPFLSSHFFLCAVVVGMYSGFGQLFQVLKSHFTQLQSQAFMRTLAIQGFSRRQRFLCLLRHAFPVCISILMQDLPLFFSGAIVISIVFNLATLGPFFQTAIMQQDTNLIMAIIVILSCLVQIGQLMADFILFRTTARHQKIL